MFPFQVMHLKAFLEPAFFIGYVDYRITGKVRPRYSDFFEKWRFTFDRNNNDRFFEAEKEISAGTYYNDKKDLFYARDSHTKYSEPTIKDEQKFMLTRINYVLNKNKSNFKIIISPSYDQLKMHNSDIAGLVSIFGPESVYDYSGINKYTSDIHNFYETIHFRRVVGKMILDEIYGQ